MEHWKDRGGNFLVTVVDCVYEKGKESAIHLRSEKREGKGRGTLREWATDEGSYSLNNNGE